MSIEKPNKVTGLIVLNFVWKKGPLEEDVVRFSEK